MRVCAALPTLCSHCVCPALITVCLQLPCFSCGKGGGGVFNPSARDILAGESILSW